MSIPNPSTALARTVIDSLVSRGTRLLALSPGSRSGAIAIAASQHPDLVTVVFLDERSAAFFALGRSKATGVPAAVLCTSGTATANWYPAVVEADASGTPLILLTADRPEELRGVGANQTIDQVGMYGNKVRFFADIPAPDGTDQAGSWRTAVNDAFSAAMGGGHIPGPSHLNLSFREPTVPVGDDGRSSADSYAHPIDGAELRGSGSRPTAPVPDIDRMPAYHPKGLLIAGDGEYDRVGLLNEASRLGWPVLATALSGMRGMDVVRNYHYLLAGVIHPSLVPDLVVAFGAIGPSERLEKLIARSSIRVRIDLWGRPIDPARNATHRLTADPLLYLKGFQPHPDQGWGVAWTQTDLRVGEKIANLLDESDPITSAGVARVIDGVPRGALVVASSLPIRAIDAHLSTSGPVVGNRGASGIDGFVSTALGVASSFQRTVALAGDLSLLHDDNGFLNDGDFDLTTVVMNNGGGGLFDLLPQRVHAPDYERLFVARQDRDLGVLAAFHNIAYERVTDLGELADVVTSSTESGGLSLIEVPVDRNDDLDMWTQLDEVAGSVVANI